MNVKPSTLDEAYQELQAIVQEFENEEIDLEKSIPKFKKGLELAKYLEDKLTKIKNEVREIKEKFSTSDIEDGLKAENEPQVEPGTDINPNNIPF